LEERNWSRWYSFFGLNEARRVNRAIGQKLSAEFRMMLLAPVDEQYSKALAGLTPSTGNNVFAQYVDHLVTRIQLVKERLRDADQRPSLDRQPPSIPLLRLKKGEADADTKEKFGWLYATSLRWFPHDSDLNRELTWLQSQLKRALLLKGNSPQWVVAWANAQRSAAPITLRDYWGGDFDSASDAVVPAIFSRKNKDLIDYFFGEIEAAVGDPAELAELKAEFARWYRLNAADAWRKFAVSFPQGARLYKKREDWRKAVPRMAKNENPYYTLLNDIATELEPVVVTMGTDIPSWLKEVYRFRDLQVSTVRSTFAGFSLRGKPSKNATAESLT
jgi:type VI secretion system protein ImpL